MEELHLSFQVVKVKLAGFGGCAGFIESNLDFFSFFDEGVVLFISLRDLEGKGLFG